MKANYHKSVLLKEAVSFLNVTKGHTYIDATLGGGGHTREILNQGGKVFGFDMDTDALGIVEQSLKNELDTGALRLAKGNFLNIEYLAKSNQLTNIYGIIFDLGLSSNQLENAERGFSFSKKATLDMRMDIGLGVKAGDLINILSKKQLYDLFYKLGEERFSKVIAGCIVDSRRVASIQTTEDLSNIIDKCLPSGINRQAAKARIFQALRIAVNDEIENLKIGLKRAFKILSPGGRICVISFHSLEDRLVKNQFARWASDNMGTIITKKPVFPDKSEIEANNRARSAKLRVFQKII